MTFEELQRRIKQCQDDFERMKKDAYDRYKTCNNGPNPHSLDYCMGELTGALRVLTEMQRQCILDALAEFFTPPPGVPG